MHCVSDLCFGRINLILRTSRQIHVDWGHDSIAEDWSHRSYRGALDSCKAIVLANPENAAE